MANHSHATADTDVQRHDAVTCTVTPSRRRGGRHNSAVYLLIAIAIGAIAAALPLLSDRNAYFIDEMQAYFMPTYYAIGQTLRQTGYLPFLTTQTWCGGNLTAEYQFALFNPIALASYAISRVGGLRTISRQAASRKVCILLVS